MLCTVQNTFCVFSHLSLKTSLWCRYYYYLHLTGKEIESLGAWTVTQGHQHLLKLDICLLGLCPHPQTQRGALPPWSRRDRRYSPRRNYPAQMCAVHASGSKTSGLLGLQFLISPLPSGVGQRSVLESGCHWLCDLGEDTWVGRWQYCGSIRLSINTGFLAKWLDTDHLT